MSIGHIEPYMTIIINMYMCTRSQERSQEKGEEGNDGPRRGRGRREERRVPREGGRRGEVRVSSQPCSTMSSCLPYLSVSATSNSCQFVENTLLQYTVVKGASGIMISLPFFKGIA